MDNANKYLSLNLGTIEIKQSSRQSIYRHWNRLHRLQKSLLIVFFVLIFIYIYTHINFHHNSLQNINAKHEHEVIIKNILKADLKVDESDFEKEESKKQIEGSHLKNIKIPNRKSFKGATNDRQQSVIDAFQHAWTAYKKYAWGQDELKPISKRSETWFNLGLTIVDSLDTIYIMNLQDIFKDAKEWVENSLSFEINKYNNLFEITIRILGGLLSAYNLSGDKIFLEKAYDLGNRSLAAFQTPSSIPFSDINLKKRHAKSPYWTTDSSISEVATLQLEFKELSYLTGDDRFKTAVNKVSKAIHKLNKPNGLVPIYISTTSGNFMGRTITLGARGDSYYEYLLKQWIQTGAVFDKNHENYYLLEDWLTSVKGVEEKLIRKTKPNGLTFIGELIGGSFSPKMDHLVCFYPGNLALGALFLKDHSEFHNEAKHLLELAKQLTETCNQMYVQMETGLSPEIAHFNTVEGSKEDIYIKDADTHNLLRPETVESLYYMYKITGEKKYQQYGWKIFEAFEKYTKIESGGYTSIDNVRSPSGTRPRDKMESFFLAETLKYFYLLFEDETNENFDLKKWIINTEAHLSPVHY